MQKSHSKYEVLLVQLPHPSCPDRNVPLAAGYLKAAAFQQNLLNDINIEILDSTFSDYAGCQMLTDVIISKEPHAIGFSLYLWNLDRTLSIINHIKTKQPNITVIVGGPEATKKSKKITKNPNIDIAVFGEGENTFIEIIKCLTTEKPKLKEILGIGYRKNKKFYINKSRPRIQDINLIPSPYLLGYLDPKKHREILLFTMKGCMLGCSYCSWTARGKLTAFNLQRIEQELLLAKKDGRQITISLIDSALNTSPIFHDFCKLVEKVNQDELLKINCFIQADLIDEIDAKLLKQSGFKSVEVGLQTANPEALANVNRYMNVDKFLRGVQLLKKEGINVGVDVIVGLPGDSPVTFDQTMKFLSDNDLNPMIFQLSVSKAAHLATQLKDFEGKAQPYPPYYLKQTKTYSKKQLQQTFKKYREKYSDLDKIINLNYPAILLTPESEQEYWLDPVLKIQQIDYPIRNIVLKACPTIEEMNMLADVISGKVSNSLIILHAYNEDDPNRQSIQTLLQQISSKNEHITCIHLVENKNPSKTKKELKKYIAAIKNPKTFLDHRDEIVSKYLPKTHRRSVNIFEIHEPVTAQQIQGKKFYIKKLTINCEKDKLALIEELKNNLNYGLLIDFAPGLNMEFIRSCMNILVFCGKDIYYKDWVIQRIWEQEYLRITPAPSPLHYEIVVSENRTIFGKKLDEYDLLWHSISDWKIMREDVKGVNVADLVMELIKAHLTLKTQGE